MKRLILLFVTLTLVTYTFAQLTERNFSIGPRVGVNFSKVSNTNNADYKSGLVAGLTSTYSITENSGLTFDALYSREGSETESEPQLATELDYLRFLLAYDLFFRDLGDRFRPKIYVGPTLGVLLSAENQIEGAENDVDVKENYNTLDVGLALGLGFNLRIGEATWLNVDGRYLPGLTNIIDNKPSGADAIRNQGFQLSLGLAFGL
ncbi:MAG: porin family protein [Saprospiraceae bacterium]